MRDWIAAFGARGFASPWRRLGAALLVVAICAPGIARIEVSSDISRLIAQRSEASTGLVFALQGFTSSDAVYALVEVPEPAPELLAEAGEVLSDAFEAHPRVISARSRPAEGLPATDPTLFFEVADEESLRAADRRLSPEGITARASALKQLLTGPTGAEVRSLLLADPFGLLQLLGDRVSRGVPRMDAAGGGFIAPDGQALLLVLRAEDDGAGDFHAGFVQELRGIRDGVLAEHPEWGATVGLTGAWVHGAEIASATRRDATILSVTSILAVLLLYLGFYRSLTSLGLVFWILPASAAITLGIGGYVLDELSPLAAGVLAVLFGLGIDPAVHLISRFREARLHAEPAEACVEALRGVGPAVVVATVTSSCALFGMGLIDPRSLGQLGFLAGLGLLVNACLMVAVLPALWRLLGRGISPDAGVGASSARRFAGLLHRRGLVVVVGVAIATGVAVLAAPPPTFEASVRGFQPEELEPVRVDRALERHFQEDAGRLMVVLRGEDEQAVLEANDAWAGVLEQLQADGALRSFETLGVLRVSDSVAGQRRAAASQRYDVPAVVAGMREALVAEGFVAAPFEASLQRVLDLGQPGSEGEEPAWISWFEEKHLWRLGEEVRVLSRVHPVDDAATTAEALRAHRPTVPAGVTDYVTGMPLVEAEAAAGLEASLRGLVGVAGLALLLVLVLHYRRPRVVLLAFLPLVAAVTLFVALHGALGVPLTPFGLAAIPLLVGIGIDDHLFMLDRYLESGSPGRLDDTLSGAGRAILVTTLTTLAAFGVLSISQFDALAAFGQSVAMALGLAFFSSVVVLPALLARFLPGLDAPDRAVQGPD